MATMNDVAKLAGVSRGTVSNFINGAKIKEESAEKIRQAMAELEYIPNAYARSLKTQRSYTVALIMPTVWFPFFSALANEITQDLSRYGYKLLLCLSNDDVLKETEYISMAQENKVDGILLITYSDVTPHLKNKSIPMVAIERYFSRDIAYVSVDNFLGGEMAAQNLKRLGCKKVCFIGRHAEKNQVADLRRKGFTSWCQENSLDFDEYYEELSSQEFMEKLDQFIREKFADGNSYDGIFTAVDRYAEYILDTLKEIRPDLKIGEDLQIIGYDGIPAYEHQKLTVSSIQQPVKQMAQMAVDMLMKQIKQEEYDKFVLLEPEFVQAATTSKHALNKG